MKPGSLIRVPGCGRLLVVAALTGCTVVPAPIYGPGPSSGAGVGGTWAVGWSRARARVADAKGIEHEVEGNGAHLWGDPQPAATALQAWVPALVSVHLGSAPLDGALYAGWRRFGVAGRVALLAASERAVTSLNFAGNLHWTGRAYDASAGVEQTLPLEQRLQLLLRADLGAGRRNLAILMPQELDPTYGLDNRVGGAHFDLLRDDVRLEVVVGLVFRRYFTLSVQPYFVLGHGAPRRAVCDECYTGTRLVSFHEASGFAVDLTILGYPNLSLD